MSRFRAPTLQNRLFWKPVRIPPQSRKRPYVSAKEQNRLIASRAVIRQECLVLAVGRVRWQKKRKTESRRVHKQHQGHTATPGRLTINTESRLPLRTRDSFGDKTPLRITASSLGSVEAMFVCGNRLIYRSRHQ